MGSREGTAPGVAPTGPADPGRAGGASGPSQEPPGGPGRGTPKGLEARLGLGAVLAISLGAMMGSGVFVLPGIAYGMAGPDLWLAYLLAGLFVLPAALSKSELATAMPVSGGSYVYIDRAFGPLASTIFGLGLWLSLLLKSAFALVGFGAYLAVLTSAPVQPLALGLLVGILALNVVGVKKVGRVQSVVVAASLAGLAVLGAWGLVGGTPVDLSAATEPTWPELLACVGLVYISYAGVTKVAAVAEEVREPSRNLPLGMLLSLLIASVLYSSITYLMAARVPAEQLAGDLHPVHLLAQEVAGPAVAVGFAVLAIATMVSMANAGLLASSRFPFAMARDGLLPARLRHVHEGFRTPVAAIFLTGALMAVAVLFLDVKSLAKLASSMMIAGFLAVNLAVIVLRESSTQWYRPTWKTPLYPLPQVVGVVVCVGLLVLLGWTGIGAFLAIAVAGVAVFLWIGRGASRTGVLGRLGPRRQLLTETARPGRPGAGHTPVNALPSRAQVVVPILGHEPSAEALAEVGAALASGGRTEVVRLHEVPDQISAEAFDVETAHTRSLRRRVDAMATERGLAIEFDAFAVHDVIRVVHEISKRVHCEWVVMEWSGRSRGSWLLHTPLGWLMGHLRCNLALFKDAGIRSYRRILVLCEPGPHDALIAGTADHLARVQGAELVFVRFVHEREPAAIAQAQSDYLDELAGLCSRPPETHVVRGRDQARTIAALTPGHDLLLVGAPPTAKLRTYLTGHWVDRLTRMASCSVLRLKATRGEAHAAVHRGATPAVGRTGGLLGYLVPGSLRAGLEVSDKEGLFHELARSLAAGLERPGLEERIEEALWAREATQNTSMGLGLAMPHATVDEVDRTWLAVLTTAAPVDFRSADGAAVDVVFVTIGPPSDRATHLKLLAGMSRLVLEGGLLDRLRAATGDEELEASLRAALAEHPETPEAVSA